MKLITHFGKYVLFLRQTVARPEKAAMYRKEIMRQMYDIGVGSISIISVVAVFIGAVTSVQFAYQISNFFVPVYYLGYVIRDSMIIEMAPTISCMMLAGKVGSNMASELGNMRITEQVDALEIMGVNTIPYLVGTKILAALLTVPSLVIIAAFLGIIGGMVAVAAIDVCSFSEYTRGLHSFYVPSNVNLMLIKSVVFAFILSSISCYQGYNVKGGAIQLGEASTRAVVYSNILIPISDYVVARLFI